MLEIVAWIVGIYLAIGLLWTAFAAFFSIGLRLPFTLRDFVYYMLCLLHALLAA